MRRYPIWDILRQDDYESMVEALLSARRLRLEDLDRGPDSLHPPESMVDMERGAGRLAEAVRRGEKIVVFGDYDVDGVTSTAVLLDFLEAVGAPCDYLLPDRHTGGYGIRPEGVQQALDKGAGLIVTVDNGISAFEGLELARDRGLDVVVVDHHNPHDRLPPAHSIINPNRRDCPYPFKGLAGVGVTFKLVQVLSQEFMPAAERRGYLNQLLDLVVLGTVADVVPVLEENRVLIQRGLEVLETTQRPGLCHLKVAAGCADRPPDTTAVAFYLGPRLNVAGRLATADLALQLLRTRQDSEAALLAERLNSLNQRRQQLQREALKEAGALVHPEELEGERMLVLLGESWHLGVIGLLASKLAEQHSRPAVVCTEAKGDGTYVGSARSIPGYDISEAVAAGAAHLQSHGGHAGAAGFSLEAESFEAFRAVLLDHARAHLSLDDLQARLRIDLVIRARDLGPSTLDTMARLEPFGNGNEVPVFALREARVLSVERMGRDGVHLKLSLEADGRACRAIWWNQGAAAGRLARGERVAVAFGLEADRYAGGGAAQMVLKDMHPLDR